MFERIAAMAYHVEVRRSFQRAWAFNLDDAELRAVVLEPWARGAVLRLGEQEWEPRETSLRIIEGPELASAELAHGQGWNSAERSGRDVARELLAATTASVAVLAPSPDAFRAAAELLACVGLDAAAADAVPQARALLVVVEPDAPGDWLFRAGMAFGAAGQRTVLVAFEPGAPNELGGAPVLRGDPADESVRAELARRLRR